MDKKKICMWLHAAGIRAVKTVAQTAVATIGTAAALGLSLIPISEPTRH